MNTGRQKKGTVIPKNRKQMHLVSGEVYSTLHKEGEPKQSLEVSPAEEIGEESREEKAARVHRAAYHRKDSCPVKKL